MDAQTATVKYDPAKFKPAADTESLEGRFSYTVEEEESSGDEMSDEDASSSDDEGSSKKTTKLP